MSVTIWTGPSSEDDLNMANDSFVIIMQDILGFPVRDESMSLCGSLEGERLEFLRDCVQLALRAVRFAGAGTVPPPGIRPTFREDGTFSEGGLHTRLSALLAVIEDAVETGQPIRWS